MEKIEMFEIVKNKLRVKSLEQLSYSIFQDENLMENVEKANDCIKYLTENLKVLYDLIDTLDSEGYFDCDNKLGINNLEVLKIRDNFDLYQLGDVINLLETIEIEEVK